MNDLLLVNFIVGAILIAISLPLIKEKIKMNHWYGIRLPSTMRNEKIWYAANKKGGIMLSQLGLLVMIINLILSFVPFGSSQFAFILVTLFLLTGIVIVAVKSSSYANKLWKDENT